MMCVVFFFYGTGEHRHLHVITHTFPTRRSSDLSQLEDALTGGDIWVAFQPQYAIATNKLVGVEALARWTHPTRGPIPPDEFIVQAEKSQDIYRLTLFVMDQAIRSAAQLRERGLRINMSVNLSASLLDHSDLEIGRAHV